MAGHNHDKNALNQARSTAGNVLKGLKDKSKAAVNNYRGKACPSKRAEESANAKKTAAKSKLDGEKNTKICNIATTWGDMDIDKSTPKFGSVLRNGWDAARAQWLSGHKEYNLLKNEVASNVRTRKATFIATL